VPPSARIFVSDIFHVQGRDNLAVEALDNRPGRFGRRKGANPELILGIGQGRARGALRTSGMVGSRLDELTASELSLPSRVNGIAFAAGAGYISMRPAITSVKASGVPRNGTWVAGYPAVRRNCSMNRWPELPGPAVP